MDVSASFLLFQVTYVARIMFTLDFIVLSMLQVQIDG